jgi:hypothetical protein
LTVAQVLAWADAHHECMGQWPSQTSGPVAGAPGLTWEAVNKALLRGGHGLPGGETLAQLLRRERGRPERPARVVDVGRRLEARWLRGQGLTQEEIARRLGVSQQHVSRLLQGEARPRPAKQAPLPRGRLALPHGPSATGGGRPGASPCRPRLRHRLAND